LALLEDSSRIPGFPVFSPGESDPGWVEVRCFGTLEGGLCNKLLLRIIAEPTIEGVRKAVKIGLDMKCRRCKEVNYRVIVV